MDSTDYLLAVVVKEALLTSVSETSAGPSEVRDLPEPPQQRWSTEGAPR
jgi:hypothetical protein